MMRVEWRVDGLIGGELALVPTSGSKTAAGGRFAAFKSSQVKSSQVKAFLL